MRPVNLIALQNDLHLLAIHGGIQTHAAHKQWLHSTGIVHTAPGTSWCPAVKEWLGATLPAEDERDLVRRTLLRDPLYRLYVDGMVAAVLQKIGATARWTRFEELITGTLKPFAPRLVALMEWQSVIKQKAPFELDLSDWQWTDAEVLEVFKVWDEWNWGDCGDAAMMFPLLETLYMPLIELPVFFPPESDAACNGLLAGLAEAARQGEGISIVAREERLMRLVQTGVPLRVRSTQHNGSIVFLIGPIHVASDAIPAYTSGDCENDIPEHAKHSSWIRPDMESGGSLVFQLLEGKQGIAFLNVDSRSTVWPERWEEASPENLAMPSLSMLRTLVKAHRPEQGVDAGLEALSRHPLYGFWLQVLLLEALDRELGEESLLIASVKDDEMEEDTPEVRLFYRPRSGAAGMTVRREMAELGVLDDVMDAIAKRLGLQKVCMPYITGEGPWSFALRLLRSAEIIRGGHERWTLAEPILDKLHSGGLMTRVIRRGHEFRERLHAALTELHERHVAETTQEVAAHE